MVNMLYARQIYPTLGGETAGDLATGPFAPRAEAQTAATTGHPDVDAALTIGGQASPLMGLVVFGGMVVGIMLLAQHLGEGEEFRNVKATAYNALVISLLAVAGIPVWKFVFTRVKVPGVSTWVLSV